MGSIFAFSVAPDVAAVAIVAMLLLALAISAQMQVMGHGFGRMAQDGVQLQGLLEGHDDQYFHCTDRSVHFAHGRISAEPQLPRGRR